MAKPFYLRYLSTQEKRKHSHKDLYTDVHSSSIWKSQKTGNDTNIHQKVNKQIVVDP